MVGVSFPSHWIQADRLVGWGGGLSEHVVVPRNAVYEIPENVSLEVAGESYQRAWRLN